jgi:outer membrane biosynthesis protein TonB
MKKIIWIISCSALLFSCIGKDAKTVNTEERTTDLPTPITEPKKEAVEEEDPETQEKIKKLVKEASENAKAAIEKRKEITSSQQESPETMQKGPKIPDFNNQGIEKTEVKKGEPILAEKAKAAPGKASHSDWNRLMNNYVSADGKVNYSGLKTEKAAIDNYIADLKATAPTSDWSKQEAMA